MQPTRIATGAGFRPRSRHCLTPAWVGLRRTRNRPLWPGCPVSGRPLTASLRAGHPLPEHGMHGSRWPRRSSTRPGQAWRGIASDDHYNHVAMQPTRTAAPAGFRPSSRHRLTPAWAGLCRIHCRPLGPVRPISGRLPVVSLRAGHPLPEHCMHGSRWPRRSSARPGQAWWRITSDNRPDHFSIYPPDTHIGMDSVLSRFAPFTRFTTFPPFGHPSHFQAYRPLRPLCIPSHFQPRPDPFLFRPHRPAPDTSDLLVLWYIGSACPADVR